MGGEEGEGEGGRGGETCGRLVFSTLEKAAASVDVVQRLGRGRGQGQDQSQGQSEGQGQGLGQDQGQQFVQRWPETTLSRSEETVYSRRFVKSWSFGMGFGRRGEEK